MNYGINIRSIKINGKIIINDYYQTIKDRKMMCIKKTLIFVY